MSFTVTDYIDVRERLTKLGCHEPSGFAILPLNFESAESISEFQQTSEASTVKTLLRRESLPHDEIVDRKDRSPYVQNHSFDWIAPTLFVSAALICENPSVISIALNVISNYVTDFLKGIGGERTVKMDIVVEQSIGKSCKKVSYEGPPSGLKDLADILRSTSDE